MFGRPSKQDRKVTAERAAHAETIVDLLNTGYPADAAYEARRFAATYGTVSFTDAEIEAWRNRHAFTR